MGDGELLRVSYGNQRTFLAFDLSPLPAGATGASVARAALHIHVNKAGGAGVVTIAVVNGPWNENSLTQNNAPAIGLSLATLNVLDDGVYVTADVTSAVQAWLTNPSSATETSSR